MNYNGRATIEFPVYRNDVNGDEQEIILQITGSSYFQAGRYSGAPEDCYPDEGDTELEEFILNGKTWDGELTEDEYEIATERMQEAVQDEDSDYAEVYSSEFEAVDQFEESMY